MIGGAWGWTDKRTFVKISVGEGRSRFVGVDSTECICPFNWRASLTPEKKDALVDLWSVLPVGVKPPTGLPTPHIAGMAISCKYSYTKAGRRPLGCWTWSVTREPRDEATASRG